jgi:ADP-dependent NAD(P)H-hydrate dehydratase / NAD(P)H-hydrate epimerase
MAAEILTVAQCYAADGIAAAAGRPLRTLMENAGRAVADAIGTRFSPRRTVVLCGPGNNGGDGFVAACALADRGWPITVALLGDVAALKGDVRSMAEQWRGPIKALSPSVLVDCELIVDALFGAGLSRPLDGAARDVVETSNALEVPVVSVDLPSGLSGDTGAPSDSGVCVHADLTITFFRCKPAHLLMPGRMYCGDTVVVDIGVPEVAIDSIQPSLFENGPALWGKHFPWPDPLKHKYARGHAVVVSGPVHATGAARLAARAALRAGAGLVSVASPVDAVIVNATALTAVMVKPFRDSAELAALLADKRFNAVAIGPGCGVGPLTAELVAVALASGAGAILDADALSSFAEDPSCLYRQVVESSVLTPHAGEFARVFPGRLETAPSRIEAVRAASVAAGCTVLLKGPDTIIAEPCGRAAINANAPASLATAGSGDVLTGIIAGLRAQGMGPFEAAAAGVWLHGEAATQVGPGLIAEDLSEAFPAVLRALRERLG